MRLRYITGLLLVGILCFNSCNKYPEGPGISFVSKKSRVANEWAFASAIESDVDVTSDYQGAVLTLDKSGGANFKFFVVSASGVRTLIEQDGNWSFSEKKEHLEIILYATTGSYFLGFEIQELRRNSMHLRSNELDKDWQLISNHLR